MAYRRQSRASFWSFSSYRSFLPDLDSIDDYADDGPYVALTSEIKVRVAVVSVSIAAVIFDIVFAATWVVTTYKYEK